jgi:hypothetical protein
MVRPTVLRLIRSGWLGRLAPLPGTLFRSTLRSARLSSQLGLWLGVAFAVCFLTGLYSHALQHPGPLAWPSRPTWLYRLTQGVHVATGLACVPLLGAKLWSVYPALLRWPPVRGVRHALERASVAVLVAAALFQLVTGLLNVARWYQPMGFFFTTAHYWTAWLAIGALLVHVAVQLPVIRRELTGPAAPVSAEPVTGGLTRRGLLAAVAASAGVITVATLGQSVGGLDRVSVLAPRRPRLGPQRLPVNTSAAAARVEALALDPGYRLRLTGSAGTRSLSPAQLAALPQHTVRLPIACVEGWSAEAEWTGVRIADLLELVGAGGRRARVISLQTGSAYASSILDEPHARDPATLLALRLHGEPLALDHGYPARLIAPNRPGVLQTKWVAAIRAEPG